MLMGMTPKSLLAGLAGAALAVTAVVSVPAAGATSPSPAVPSGLPVPGGTVSGPDPVPEPPIDFAAGDVCPFAIHESFPVNQVVAYTYTTSSGRVAGQYFTGALVGHITRVGTGRSIDVDLSGDGVSLYDASGATTIYGLGPYQVGFHAGDHPSHELARITGFSVLRISAAGTKTLVYGPQIENLCRRLA